MIDALTFSITSTSFLGIYVPGPSNNHSSPAMQFLPFSSVKSSTARNRRAELAFTTVKGVLPFFKTSPGYNGKGSCAKRISWKE